MIVTVIGARPQFVKAAVVSKALVELGIKETIIHTGQHYDNEMNEVFWEELGLPQWDINLMAGSGTHGRQTALMLEKIEEFLLKHLDGIKALLLYGDTNSTLAGAVAASKLNIPIIHIEAGLRSFNRTMPEEINRIVTDHLSANLFCSSEMGKTQLAREGITSGVYVVGDVMYDAVREFSKLSADTINLRELFPDLTDFFLLTIHRPSNTDSRENLTEIIEAAGRMSKKVLWPVHPRIRKKVSEMEIPGNVVLSRPLSYLEMLAALNSCSKVITDSGGLQKEAYWCKKPCITVRTETEWVETLEGGWNMLTGPDCEKILKAVDSTPEIQTWKPLYGTGNAATVIAETIRKNYYNV